MVSHIAVFQTWTSMVSTAHSQSGQAGMKARTLRANDDAPYAPGKYLVENGEVIDG